MISKCDLFNPFLRNSLRFASIWSLSMSHFTLDFECHVSKQVFMTFHEQKVHGKYLKPFNKVVFQIMIETEVCRLQLHIDMCGLICHDKNCPNRLGKISCPSCPPGCEILIPPATSHQLPTAEGTLVGKNRHSRPSRFNFGAW